MHKKNIQEHVTLDSSHPAWIVASQIADEYNAKR